MERTATDMGFLFGVMKCSKLDCGDGCTLINIPNAIELYFNG